MFVRSKLIEINVFIVIIIINISSTAYAVLHGYYNTLVPTKFSFRNNAKKPESLPKNRQNFIKDCIKFKNKLFGLKHNQILLLTLHESNYKLHVSLVQCGYKWILLQLSRSITEQTRMYWTINMFIPYRAGISGAA